MIGRDKTRPDNQPRLGIFFDLSSESYHADSAIGGTELRKLLMSSADYWWRSPLNPHRPDNDATPQQEYGTALHKRVLEGSQKFAVKYIRRPDDLKVLTAKAKERLCPNGEIVLNGEDFDRIEIAADLIAANPDLAAALSGGVPEVSVFWTHDLDGFEIRCKARFDFLKIRGVGDLKSIRNMYGIPFGDCCARAIHNYRYDMQAVHYLEGRSRFPMLVSDGAVYGDHDPTWLKRVADNPLFAFQWIFFQAEGAPITWSRSLTPGNPVFDIATRDRMRALEIYRACKQTFADDQMWVQHEPVKELDINELPGWYR